jgi:stage II sporulation protein D
VRGLAVTLAVACAAALAAASLAAASTVFVVDGRGWGHGIGMSQWGAYGYARHGWSYPHILRHYYPGTTLARTDAAPVRVLLAQDRVHATVGCAAPLTVADGAGRSYHLRAGFYALGPRLKLPVAHKRVRVRPRRHHARHRVRFRRVTVRRALPQPLTFDCPAAPLTLDGSAYHGLLVIHRWGGRLTVVNVVSLENYLRGVVGGEMPSRWNLAALEAQAVAARSYVLATLKPDQAYDVYADTRSQVYGGIAYESARTSLAVARTAGRILTWHGRPAATFFFSTSGGRTAAIRDVWPAARALPYLRSVSDPYDVRSPHHRWGPLKVTPAELGAPRARVVRVERNASGRVAAVDVGGRRIPATRVEARLRLPSTWFRIGELSLRAGVDRLVFGNAVTLRGSAVGVGTAALQARTNGGRWRTIRRIRAGRFAVRVSPAGSTRYRIASRGIAVAPVAVAVAPRLHVELASAGRLDGLVSPRTSAALAVARRTARGWRVVAHPRLDARGRFSLPLRARGGELRVTVAGNRALASATTHVQPRPSYLASVGP